MQIFEGNFGGISDERSNCFFFKSWFSINTTHPPPYKKWQKSLSTDLWQTLEDIGTKHSFVDVSNFEHYIIYICSIIILNNLGQRVEWMSLKYLLVENKTYKMRKACDTYILVTSRIQQSSVTLSQTTTFRLFQTESLQTIILSLIKMAESSPNRKKTMWEKEKLLVRSNFSFFHIVFKRLVLQTCKNQGLLGKGLSF